MVWHQSDNNMQSIFGELGWASSSLKAMTIMFEKLTKNNIFILIEKREYILHVYTTQLFRKLVQWICSLVFFGIIIIYMYNVKTSRCLFLYYHYIIFNYNLTMDFYTFMFKIIVF
jgi:hypothetical protein